MKNFIIFIFLFIYGCAIDQPIQYNHSDQLIEISPFGTQSTLDIITWNVQNFPKNGNITISAMNKIIQDLNVDLIALQEIEGNTAFNNIIDSLGLKSEGWEGYRSNSASYSINLAYLYNTSKLTIHSIYEIFTDDWSSFPRSPLVLEFSYKNEDFIIINNHLKCCDYDYPEEKNRRESALNKLQQYIIDEFYNKKVIIIGDMNDSITDNESSNVFTNFLNDSLFYFVDIDIAFGSSSNWSYPTYPSHIDHIIISNAIFDIFNSSDLTTVQTLKIDNELNGGWTEYDLNISDHRPVGIRLEIND